MLAVAEQNEVLKPIKMSTLNLDKVLRWSEFQDIAQVEALIAAPPLRSVVATIAPAVARQLLIFFNKKNRHLSRNAVHRAKAPFKQITGDTIKFSVAGLLIDGQHRLELCKVSGQPFTTHVVFGIKDEIFDLLDQGKKRSVADALSIDGMPWASSTAGAGRWILALQKNGKINQIEITVQELHRFIVDDHPKLHEWAHSGLKVSKAVRGWSGAMLQAMLYLAAQKVGSKVAGQFAADWLTGVRIGRNTVFDALAKRVIELKAGNRPIPTQVRAALLIIVWNHWQANIQPSYRAIGWNATKPFPKMAFSKAYAGEEGA